MTAKPTWLVAVELAEEQRKNALFKLFGRDHDDDDDADDRADADVKAWHAAKARLKMSFAAMRRKMVAAGATKATLAAFDERVRRGPDIHPDLFKESEATLMLLLQRPDLSALLNS